MMSFTYVYTYIHTLIYIHTYTCMYSYEILLQFTFLPNILFVRFRHMQVVQSFSLYQINDWHLYFLPAHVYFVSL